MPRTERLVSSTAEVTKDPTSALGVITPTDDPTDVDSDEYYNEVVEEDFIPLDPETEHHKEPEPTGFLRLNKQVRDNAKKRSDSTPSESIAGTRSSDGTLWIDGKKYLCPEAYELAIMSSLRGQSVTQALSLHIADKTYGSND